MHRIAVVVLVLLAGCAAGRRSVAPVEGARVVSLTPLPRLSASAPLGGLKMDILFLVQRDGSVADVRFVESSGDPSWDRAAADSMRQWRFVLQEPDTSLEAQWVRTSVIVQFQEPDVMTLGELTVGTRKEADSLYALLREGADFSTLARELSKGTSNQCGWFLGAINISRYPRHIRQALRTLAVNEITPPLQVDSHFAIFKRLEPGAR